MSIPWHLHISKAIKPQTMSVVSAPDKKMMVANEVVVFGGMAVRNAGREVEIVPAMVRRK